MKSASVSILLMVLISLASLATAQVAGTGLPDCVTVGEWPGPGAVRAISGDRGILVSWIPDPGVRVVEGYEVVRATALNGPYEQIALVQNTVTQYVDESAAPATFYWYRVRGFGEGLCSRFSDPVRGMR